ncbi:hypothetical protein N7645_15065 [Pseudomonas juntendi]|uniref:hypothetical protein n=1 Tax=Pseudomonas TaxID=286 RepID=UPI0012ADAF4D|nr:MULTISPECIES: hypothetical protein [Pseudomonas]MDG9918208.1 hypothetical protein [Pseudomonas juntendi]MDH0507656.1 hypothetical protein [Pseudomonas juntendi]MDH1044862.1 hypothetical protein [Pseudomonas juntendi]MRT62325.1 hypothetical protein [Pseudomonas sp. CAH-1]
MSTKLSEWQLISDLLQLARSEDLSTYQYLAAGRLAVALPCLAQGMVRLGFAFEYAERYESWPMSVRFCVQMLTVDGLAESVVMNLRSAMRLDGVDPSLTDMIEGICRIMDGDWIALPGAQRKVLAGVFARLLETKNYGLVAERMFGAPTICEWGLELDLDDTYELVPAALRVARELGFEQFAHITDHGELALLMHADVISSDAIDQLSEPAREYLLGVEMGL